MTCISNCMSLQQYAVFQFCASLSRSLSTTGFCNHYPECIPRLKRECIRLLLYFLPDC
jgi:hypothetical protein